MQKKILWIGLAFMLASSLQVNAQYAKQDSTYKKYFVGSTFLMLGNLIPDDPNPPDFIQLNVGYRITPKHVVFLELKTSKFNWPLGMPWDEIVDEQRAQYNFPGYVRQYVLGVAYNRFWWKGLYTGVHAMNAFQTYRNEDKTTAGSNYVITYVGSDFNIAPKPITVTADAGLTSIYGEADPTFTFTVFPALVSGDVFTGSLARTAGENVGTYAINQNTLTAGNNYTISYVGSDFSITPKAITVTADAGQTSIYGEADPTFTFTVSPALVSGDVFTGSLARTAGENVGTYAINQNTLTAGNNYTISYVGSDFSITPKAITVTADAGKSKRYGEADPAWTYTVSPPLVNGDVITGSLARAPGENIGAYAIHQHTLTAGSNYTIVYVSADFHIMKLSQTILFDPIPDKTLGEEPFFLVATASSSLPLFFTSSNESVATISDNVMTIIGTGEVTITATQPGNDIYDPQEAMETLTIHASSIFIPTLFSPDGNGVNDMFRVRGADIAEIQFVVFDLLGNEVYRATDAVTATERGWDGTKGGKDQPAGTYSWMLKGKLKNGASMSFEGKSYGQVVLMR